MKLKNVILVLMICNPLAAFAFDFQTKTGNDLFRLYQSDKRINGESSEVADFMASIYLTGYVGGAVSVLLVNGVKNQEPKICLSSNYITNQQYVDVVGKYLEDHPGERDQSSLSLLPKILELSFPCKNK